MRKLIAALLLGSAAYGAALNGTMGWNVTNNANGNSANGGGFDAGVSSPGANATFSNPVAFTDLVCTGTTCTSVTLAFGATSVGNTVNVTSGSGCTTGRYEILSQSGGTATFNAAIGTCTGSGNYGGALATWADAETIVNSSTAGQIIWIQATGTAYTITSAVTGATVAEHSVWGYQTAWGDQIGVAWASRVWPIIQSNTASMNIFELASGESTTLDSLELLASGSTFSQFAIHGGVSGSVIVRNCKIYGAAVSNTVGIDVFSGANSVQVENSEIYNWYDAFFLGNQNVVLIINDSWIHGNSHYGLGDDGNLGGQSINLTTINSVWDSNGYGIHLTTTSSVASIVAVHSVFSNSTNDGINNQTAHFSNKNINVFSNNIFYGNGGWGIIQPNCFSGPQGAYGEPAFNNGVGSNGSGNYSCITSQGDVALSANPFTSGSVFTLNSTAGGGAALKAAGFPGTAPFGVGYGDIGAAQSKATSQVTAAFSN